jgi:hypothetical protein
MAVISIVISYHHTGSPPQRRRHRSILPARILSGVIKIRIHTVQLGAAVKKS